MKKAQAPELMAGCFRTPCRASYGPGLIGYQSGAGIVRQAQEQTGPEYIRPGAVPSKLAVTPAAYEVHNNVRWGKPDMGIETQFARAIEAARTELVSRSRRSTSQPKD